MNEFERNVDRLFVKPEDIVLKRVHAAAGIASESGELFGAIKANWIYGRELDLDNVLEECGDLLFYISAMLTSCGFTLNQAMFFNIAKLERRYPAGYTDDAANIRADKIRQGESL